MACYSDDTRMINIIREYRANLPEPSAKWPSMEFDRIAYTIWATDELLVYVLANMNVNVWTAVTQWRQQMLGYSCIADYTDANFMFEIAYEVGDDILEIFDALI